MIIHFGLHLDGMQPAPPVTAAGEIALGPGRLLDVLEIRLGLPPVRERPGEALLAYQGCLAELDESTRFYHQSFAVDPIGVARTLLRWRKRWYEAGWSGSFSDDVSKRLRDLSDIEVFACVRLPLTHGQRLQRVCAALDNGLRSGIERLLVHGAVETLPVAWRPVLERLGAETASALEAPRAKPGSDLHRVQSALLELGADDRPRAIGAHAGDDGKMQLAADESLIIVRGISRDLSAQAIAEYLRERQAFDETVVIAERDGIIVDNALERVGLARAGFQHYSRFRAITQVLKLCFALVWEPVSPHLLLQFLIHPVGPLPRHARATLAEAVAAEPGVGGTAWMQALGTIERRLRETYEVEERGIKALKAEIVYWLQCERFQPEQGAPLEALSERAQRCASWLAGRLAAAEDDTQSDLLAAAQAQAVAFATALGELYARGEVRIGRIALEQLVDEVSAQAADPATFAEAGHVRSTTDPASITAPWRTIVWWDLAPVGGSLGWPWSDAELAALGAEGVALPSVEERVRMRLREWLRPVLNAEEQLVLVIHDRDDARHPIWTRLLSLFEGFNEVRIEDALLCGDADADDVRRHVPALNIATEPLTVTPLPRPRRWWTLPADCPIPARERESFSSLDKLIFHPHEWVLLYAARLYRGRASDLASGNLLNGNLAHRVFERFFSEHSDWIDLDEPAERAWFAAYAPRLIAEEGALLNEPGTGVMRDRVLSILESAFLRLLAILRSAGVVSAAGEQFAEAPFNDVMIGGTIDLVLRDTRGREIVLDVKWGGQGWRAEELTANLYLQLATYAYLRREANGGAWPYYAYFIVETGNVIAPDTSVFPEAVVAPPAEPERIDALWRRVAATYDWRRAQIAAGHIEVNAHRTEPTAESEPPPGALDTAVPPGNFDEFTWLTGWEET